MQRRPFVLYICSRNCHPSLAESVLARAGFGVLLAITVEHAIAQLTRADVVVVSSCWPKEKKHHLLDALLEAQKTRSKVPIICINEDPHGCNQCTEADPLQPENLVAVIRKLALSSPRSPASFGSEPQEYRRWWIMRKGAEYTLAYIAESSISEYRRGGWQLWETPFDSCQEAETALEQWRGRPQARSSHATETDPQGTCGRNCG